MTPNGNSLVEYVKFANYFFVDPTLVSSEQHSMTASSTPRSAQSQAWDCFLNTFFSAEHLPASPLQALFEPLRTPTIDRMMVVGQLGQTMDGRIATVTGQSKYINGQPGLTHLHQLRALLDAVVVGVGTALADDPQLNVRLVRGQHPARVVIDPKGRLSADCRIWNDDGARRLWVVAQGLALDVPPGVDVLALPATDGRIEPMAILKSLSAQGLNRILIEGGAETVSRFLQAGCLDRLHMIVAPIIMGSGRPSFNLPIIEHMDQAVRLPVQTHLLDNEVLFDCDLTGQRLKIC